MGIILITGCASSSMVAPGVPTEVIVTPDIPALFHYGDTLTLKVTAKDAAGRPVHGDVVWGSSDPKVITVSPRGTLTAVSCGTATITATVQGVTGRAFPGVPSVATDPLTERFASSLGVNMSAMTRQPGGVYVQDLIVGGGSTVTRGTAVMLKVNAWMPDGTLVRSEVARVTASDADGGDVLTHALIGMRIGGKRRAVSGSALSLVHGFGVWGCRYSMVVEIEAQS